MVDAILGDLTRQFHVSDLLCRFSKRVVVPTQLPMPIQCKSNDVALVSNSFLMRVYLYIVEYVLFVNIHEVFEPGRQATVSLVMHMHYA